MTWPGRRFAGFVRMLLLACCMLAGGPVPSAAASGADVVVLDADDRSLRIVAEARVLVDATRELGIAEVRGPALASHFEPVAVKSGDIGFGYSAAAHWLRLHIRAPEGAAPRRWLLELAYPALDRVEFYDQGATQPLRAGDRLPFTVREIAHRNPVFPLTLAPGETRSVYLRIESEGSLLTPLVLWEPAAFDEHNLRTYSVLAMYYGALLALLLYNLLIFSSVRSPLYVHYVLMLAGMLVGQVSYNGFGNQFLWPAATLWGHLAMVVGFAVSGAFSALFARAFLRTYNHARALDWGLIVFAVLFGTLAVASFFAPYAVVAQLLTLFGMLFALTAVASGLYCWTRRVAGAAIYLLAWTAVLAGTAVLAARYHNWLPGNFLTAYAMQIGSALEMILLSFGLANIINSLRRDKARAQSEALAAQARLVDTLRQSEQQLAQRVAQRTHELKVANRQLQANEERLRHVAHHDALTGLANRLLLDDRIEHGIVRATRHNARIALLLADIDKFKPVNDSFGHAVGDDLLVAIAGRLRGVVRQEDTVARLGGDEFVLVLEDAYDIEDVSRVMDKIEAELTRPFKLGEHSVNIGVSVGYALYPEDGTDITNLLKSADKMMYAIKERRGLRAATANGARAASA